MEITNVPNLIWESVEKQLDKANHYEVRCLVGSDLVEQCFELRNEILFTLEIGKHTPDIRRKIQLFVPESSNSASVVDKTVQLFIKAYLNENVANGGCSSETVQENVNKCHSSPSDRGHKESRTNCTETQLESSLANLRSCIQREKIILEKYLQTLQSTLLNSFQPSNSFGDQYTNPNKTELTLLKGDGDEISLRSTSEIRLLNRQRQDPHNTELARDITDDFSQVSTTFMANVSSDSSASISPRISEQVAVKPHTKGSSAKNCPLKPASKQTGMNRTQISNTSTSKTYQGSVHSKTSVNFPPLTKPQTMLVSSPAKSHLVQPNGSRQNSNPLILERYNSAQRFRQMVLKNRQQSNDLNNPNGHK